MSNLVQALKDRIAILDDEIEELEDSLLRKRSKRETYEELLNEEASGESKPVKKKRGRPKGSKVKKADKDLMQGLYEEAVATLPEPGTTPEQQERLTKKFRPAPRGVEGLGPGIRAGTKKQVLEGPADRRSDATISVEDEE